MKCSKTRPLLSALVFAAALAQVGSAARADVDVTVLNADKIQGSIDTEDERETFAIQCPAGAKLVVSAKGKKGFRPSLRVLDPEQAEPFAGAIVVGKSGAKLKVDALGSSGTYTVEVTGGGATGEYKLKIAWKSPKKTDREVVTTPDTTPVEFSAGAGSRVNLKAVAAKSSSAVPELVRLEGPGDFELDLTDPSKAASDAAKRIELPANGDYVLFVRDTGGTGGAVKASISLKQPPPSKRKVDMRARTIGNAGGEQFALSDIVGKDGGSVLVPFPEDGQPAVSSIAGSSVVVPAGAVSTATAIVVATAPDVDPKGGDIGAGPSVFFGPEGLTFKTPATVTIPFDVDAFGGDTSKLVVYTRDARGKVKAVPGPYEIDNAKGTCTFAVSHFSSFRAALDVGDTGGNSEFAGVWKDPGSTAGITVLLEIKPDGSGTLYEFALDEFCFFTPLFPPGSNVSQFLTIRNGRLEIPGEGIIYDRVDESELPPPGACAPLGEFPPAK